MGVDGKVGIKDSGCSIRSTTGSLKDGKHIALDHPARCDMEDGKHIAGRAVQSWHIEGVVDELFQFQLVYTCCEVAMEEKVQNGKFKTRARHRLLSHPWDEPVLCARRGVCCKVLTWKAMSK
eukprot:CAMPEP_0172723184 /NCGR_PEP_ID=MMETSP1074-20121228/83192_1 /TAXON_ID=2916 /ORGANISM="Ceratium fusus, Strain PA161109" /LENGTH=121 /DNA_ID=CAMNT_0013549385 /DNA_START=1 /DNA_END=363 /DNA_ORIENTATION=-